MAGEIGLLTGAADASTPYPRPNPAKSYSNPDVAPTSNTFAESNALTGPEQDTVHVHPVAKSDASLIQADAKQAVDQKLNQEKPRIYLDRDNMSGKMVLQIVNKVTGEVIERIPRQYLQESQADDAHQVDARV